MRDKNFHFYFKSTSKEQTESVFDDVARISIFEVRNAVVTKSIEKSYEKAAKLSTNKEKML